MTPHEVRARVDKLPARYQSIDAVDDETSHADEDELHQDVLRYVAAEAPEPFRSCAAIALETLEIDFTRWYA